MVQIVGIRFKRAGKIYYFAPNDILFSLNEPVVVDTARGTEYGFVAVPNKEVDEDELTNPLKPVLRRATADDTEKYEQNCRLELEALEIARKKVEEHKLPLKMIDVSYIFDVSKIVFYFTADGRVDFRELVKDLAAIFHTRIELRQVGVRDEAKIVGGLACCGRELCCHSVLNDFHPVSIKMAKKQNLPLNPSKISGVCGRLMCCLKYEYYEDDKKAAKKPKYATGDDVGKDEIFREKDDIPKELKENTED